MTTKEEFVWRDSHNLTKLCAEAETVNDIRDLLNRFITGKSVLDVGCANYQGEYGFGLVHAMVLERCNRCVGVDIDPAVWRITPVPTKDVRYFQGNAEDFCLPETFDTIFAGDVIEHLSNPGRFLEQARKMMHATSNLVIVTPNPYGFRSLVGFFRGFEPPIHPEHTMLIPISGMGELASRYGLRLSQVFLIKGQALMPHDRFLARAYKLVYRGLLALPAMKKIADTFAFRLSPL